MMAPKPAPKSKAGFPVERDNFLSNGFDEESSDLFFLAKAVGHEKKVALPFSSFFKQS